MIYSVCSIYTEVVFINFTSPVVQNTFFRLTFKFDSPWSIIFWFLLVLQITFTTHNYSSTWCYTAYSP